MAKGEVRTRVLNGRDEAVCRAKGFLIAGAVSEHGGKLIERCEIGKGIGTQPHESHRFLRTVKRSANVAFRKFQQHSSVRETQRMLPCAVAGGSEAV